MRWLADCSPAALSGALRIVAPQLSGASIEMSRHIIEPDPLWWSSTAMVGGAFVAKFAWSRPAARRLAHEIGVLTALAVPAVPEVVAAGTDPVLLITRRVPGVSLFEAVHSIDPDRAGHQLAEGRHLEIGRVMAWHLRTVLGDALWRSEAGIPMPDHRTPAAWIDDLSARFGDLGINPAAKPRAR